MLAVKTNKNIEKFKSDVAGGFDLKEVMSIIIGLVVGIVVMVLAVFVIHMPMSVAPYVASLFIAIPILFKFFKPGGMGVNVYRQKQKAFKNGTVLPYISTENPFIYGNYSKSEIKKQTNIKQTEDDFEGFLKRAKKVSILLIVIIIAIVLTVILIKFL